MKSEFMSNIVSHQFSKPLSDEMNDTTMSLAESFCKNFQCCGMSLQTMHDLLEHYETQHVRIEDDDDLSPVDVNIMHGGDPSVRLHSSTTAAYPYSTHPFMPPLIPTSIMSADDMMFVRKRDYASAAYTSVFGSPNIIPMEASHDTSSAYSAFDVTVLKRRAQLGDTPEDAHRAMMRQQKQEAYMLASAHAQMASQNATLMQNMITVSPASLSGGGSSDEDGEFVDYTAVGPDGRLLHYGNPAAVNAKKPKKVVALDIPKRRKHQCHVPGCGKIYKNANGLKYHSMHSHSDSEREVAEQMTKAIRDDPSSRPYVCKVPGCDKRYKNANGLKYHRLHHHLPGTPPIQAHDTNNNNSMINMYQQHHQHGLLI